MIDFLALLILMGFVIFHSKILTLWLTITLGVKRSNKGKDYNKDYLAGMYSFFRTDDFDKKMSIAEKVLIMQKRIVWELFPLIFFAMMYLMGLFFIFNTLFGTDPVIVLNDLILTWNWVLVILFVSRWLIKKSWEGFK